MATGFYDDASQSWVNQGSGTLDDAVNGELNNLQSTFNRLVESHLIPEYKALDPNLKYGFTGSFKNGFVGNPTKSAFGNPINLKNFDIDFWIESDVLFK